MPDNTIGVCAHGASAVPTVGYHDTTTHQGDSGCPESPWFVGRADDDARQPITSPVGLVGGSAHLNWDSSVLPDMAPTDEVPLVTVSINRSKYPAPTNF